MSEDNEEARISEVRAMISLDGTVWKVRRKTSQTWFELINASVNLATL